MGEKPYGIDPSVLERIAIEIKEVVSTGVELALVVGGGNIFRGVSGASAGMDRASADYMGMLATVMNSVALQDQPEALSREALAPAVHEEGLVRPVLEQ